MEKVNLNKGYDNLNEFAFFLNDSFRLYRGGKFVANIPAMNEDREYSDVGIVDIMAKYGNVNRKNFSVYSDGFNYVVFINSERMFYNFDSEKVFTEKEMEALADDYDFSDLETFIEECLNVSFCEI